MTISEKNKLALLAQNILELSDILHSPAAINLANSLAESTDSAVMDILIAHIETLKIYEAYNRFALQASEKDIKKLIQRDNGE